MDLQHLGPPRQSTQQQALSLHQSCSPVPRDNEGGWDVGGAAESVRRAVHQGNTTAKTSDPTRTKVERIVAEETAEVSGISSHGLSFLTSSEDTRTTPGASYSYRHSYAFRRAFSSPGIYCSAKSKPDNFSIHRACRPDKIRWVSAFSRPL